MSINMHNYRMWEIHLTIKKMIAKEPKYNRKAVRMVALPMVIIMDRRMEIQKKRRRKPLII